MKLIGSLVVIASLVFGVLSAATAYLPKLSLPDERLLGLTLNAHAGGRRRSQSPATPSRPNCSRRSEPKASSVSA